GCGGGPVFYEMSREHLDRCGDGGRTFVKLGEEARVDLTTCALEGSHGKKYRSALHRLEREQATFRILPAGQSAGVMDQLRAGSDDWLARRSGGEKGFSLGFFEPEYIARFPVAVIEQGGRIVAFATPWPGAQRCKLSTDTM